MQMAVLLAQVKQSKAELAGVTKARLHASERP